MKEMIVPVAQDCAKRVGGYVIDDLYQEYVKPRLEKAKNKPQDTDVIFELIEEYLKEAYKRNKYMTTIVFSKETKTIDELYIPLTLVKNGKNNKDRKIVVDENMPNFFATIEKIMVIDTAGMGKSTLVKFIYLISLEKDYGIPFLIELRKVESGQTILEYICKELQLCKKQLRNNDIKFLLERGEFIFFLDGYDEIPVEIKKEVTESIRQFVLSYSNNKFMLTSREDESVNVFSEFEKYHIRPLEKEEAYNLIRKYDQNGEISEKLIKEIENKDQYGVLEEFLSNPLMVSLLYSSYHYKGIIQYKKHLFYRQVYDALYEGHDITKGPGHIHNKKSKLEVDSFNRLLAILGYLSIKEGKISFTKDEILELIGKATTLYNEYAAVNAYDFLKDLLYAVPLFIKEGVDYKWAHKSFAEYYAAYFICIVAKERQEHIIRSIMKSARNTEYHNVLDFCYDMDPKLAREVIVYELVSLYVQHCDKNTVHANDKMGLLNRYYSFINDVLIVKTKEQIMAKEKKATGKVSTAALLEAFEMAQNFEKEVCWFDIISRNYNAFMFLSQKPEYEITKLLYGKSVDVFTPIIEKEYSMKFLNDLEVGSYVWSETNKNVLMLEDSKKAIVSYIHHKNYTTMGEILDYDKCVRLKEKIEREKANHIDDIFTFS